MSNIVTNWMSFNSPKGYESVYRRTGNVVEVHIVWASELFESSNDAIAAGLKAAEANVSHIIPSGLPKADVHTLQPEAILKKSPFNNHYYSTVVWRLFIGPIPGWVEAPLLVEQKSENTIVDYPEIKTKYLEKFETLLGDLPIELPKSFRSEIRKIIHELAYESWDEGHNAGFNSSKEGE